MNYYDILFARQLYGGGSGKIDGKTVDLLVFAGQSNMAGRGNGADAPTVSPNAGMEFRPISDPTKLYEIDESQINEAINNTGKRQVFGVLENHAYNASDAQPDGLNDLTSGGKDAKTGSLIPAFINAYYANTGVKVIGVSASMGSTTSTAWTRANRGLYSGAINRYNTAKTWLLANGYTIRRKLMIWLQGESDGTASVTAETYIANINNMFNTLIKGSTDIEKLLVIRIGHLLNDTRTDGIMTATNTLCETTDNAVMISTKLGELNTSEWYVSGAIEHFNQSALNLVGTDAGTRAAYYVNTGIPPIMYDTFTESTIIKKKSEVLNKS